MERPESPTLPPERDSTTTKPITPPSPHRYDYIDTSRPPPPPPSGNTYIYLFLYTHTQKKKKGESR